MKKFIWGNQSVSIVLGVVLFLIVLYFIFKALPTKVAKKSKKEDKKTEIKVDKTEEKAEEKVEEVKASDVDSAEKKNDENDKTAKKEDKKPKIVQVFKRSERSGSEDGKKSRVLDPIYDRNIEFVNTSKNIAKFKSFVEEVSEDKENSNTDDFGFVSDYQDECAMCEDKVKHFDHTRRISKAIKDDSFDDMFCSHISEKYLNINSEKHLKIDEDFSDKLFARAEDTMKNGYGKLNIKEQPENVKFSLFADNQIDSLEDDKELMENISVDMKTALIAETYFGKRKKIGKK